VQNAATFHPRPADATLSVTRAAQVLGVHPNTIRAWSDAGRLRYYRINPRGDRRYRLSDLQRFLATALEGELATGADPHAPPLRRRGRPARLRGSRFSIPDPQPGSLPAFGRAGAAEPIKAAQGTSTVADAQRAPSRDYAAPLALLRDLGDLAASAIRDPAVDLDAALQVAARAIRGTLDLPHVSIWRLRGERLAPVAVAVAAESRVVELPRGFGILGLALDNAPLAVDPDPLALLPTSSEHGRETAVAIPGDGGPFGVLLVVRPTDAPADAETLAIVAGLAASLGTIASAGAAAAEVAHQLHRAEALRRVASDIGSRLDLDQILAGLVDHAIVLFAGDRGAVYLYEPDGSRQAAATRGLSQAYLTAVSAPAPRSLAMAAIAARRPLFAVHYRDDPRVGEHLAAVIQEGYDTTCVAPLLDGDSPQPLGILAVYHDAPHRWTTDELETMEALATQASVAIKGARNYAQLATWAAQLQSIQQLGARLNGLSSVEQIGQAIATELRQLIDYHNVRVYRLRGDDLVPVAMLGQVGEYVDETPEQLGVKLGEGITGWVAEHRVAQLLDDAAADARANTIPGTDDDLDESMLLAPMLFEDQVLGVLVLSKLGLRQFREDDLRLLVIYASFAAQAMANADATERLREQSAALERKVRSQRELLQITESILTTLDVRAVLDAVADRLGELVGWDNVAIELFDRARGVLTPVVAKGADADQYMVGWEPGEQGLATWVVSRNEPVLVEDQYRDGRVFSFPGGPVHGSLMAVPLRDRDGAVGVITLERLGEGRTFTEEEFELAKLFAAQVSIALQNAETHSAVERRAQTDDLTGLLNHGTFREKLAALVAADEPFSLVMLDLDRFKRVNDRMGHQAGDRLLHEIARAIQSASRESDSVFRYGGDEFTVLLPRTDPSAAAHIADRVRCAVATVVGPGTRWRGRGWKVEASAGVASFPSDGTTADEVLLAADRACFVAKRDGGGRVADAAQGVALAAEFTLQPPTPIDPQPISVGL
jgi:diguanylate cyclase (GGDEF)-like protein/excisionase family DNA binding protein